MTTIYLIRHAEAEGNLYRIAQGQDDSNLTDRGWRQVRALERRFAKIPVDAVYSSDLYRTCATASAIYRPKGLELRRVPMLREICVGEWERRTWGDIYRRWPEQMEYFSRRPDLWKVDGAEDPRQVCARGLTALRKIAAAHDGETVAVFSHGYVIRLMVSCLQGQSLEQAGQTHTGDNTAVTLLEADGDALRVVFRDDNSHLKTPEFLAGEKVIKRANGLEAGLWFQPLELPEQMEFLRELLRAEPLEKRLPDVETVLVEAACGDMLVGYLRDEPVGVVQMGMETGEIRLLCVREEYRNRGFGTQMLGQAVQRTRQRGGDTLFVTLAAESMAHRFFTDVGFVETDPAKSGGIMMKKNIGFDPEVTERCGSEYELL